LKDLSEEVDREKAGREEATKTAKDKTKAADATNKRAAAAEKARVSAEKRSVELVSKQNEMDLKLAKAASLNVTLSEEVTDLRVALEACENKWYDEGFADADKVMEPIVMQSRKLCFQEGWMTTLHALGVPEDSPLRVPGRIPIPDFSPVVQNPTGPIDEEETDSLRELVEQINAHVEMIGTKATINPPTDGPSGENVQPQPSASEHQSSEMATETQPMDLTVWFPNLFYIISLLLYLSNFHFELICLHHRAVATKQLFNF